MVRLFDALKKSLVAAGVITSLFFPKDVGRAAEKQVSEEAEHPRGPIPILMFHGVVKNPRSKLDVTPEKLKEILARLHEAGFTAVTVSEVVESKLAGIPKGRSPVCLTFDDGRKSHFNYLENGALDPNSVFAILKKFSEEHPEFGGKATFFLSWDHIPFGSEKSLKAKIEALLKEGMEVGSHGKSHRVMRRLHPKAIEKDVAGAWKEFERVLGEKASLVKVFAYPGGVQPLSRDGRALVKQFKCGEKVCSHSAAVGVDSSLFCPSPFSPEFEKRRWKLPRIDASKPKHLDKVFKNRKIFYRR